MGSANLFSYIVHCRKEAYDIYIGRPSKWQNPYTHIKDRKTLAQFIVKDRKEALEKYRQYLDESGLINDIEELRGKILGCWCCDTKSDGLKKNIKCHGEILCNILNRKIINPLF